MSFWRPIRPHRFSLRFRVLACGLFIAVWPVAFVALRFMRISGGDPAFNSDREIIRFLAVGAGIVLAGPASVFLLMVALKLGLRFIERPRRDDDATAR
jgi:hypothetical protein